jgi:surface antigen
MKNVVENFVAVALAATALTCMSAALADDDDRGKHRERRAERKEEFWDGNCKVERKWEKNGNYKEERKCEGGRGHGREHKEKFSDGNCKVERKWKDGEYKEEVKCKGRPGHAAVVYPPWIVSSQGGQVVYPQAQPVVPAGSPRCNSESVGRVLGGILGGVAGNQVGKGNGRTLATIGGAVAGVLIGGEVGRRMDAADQACVGQVLEVAPVGRRVEWVDSGVRYAVVPGQVAQRSGGAYCRPYVMETHNGHGWVRSPGTACRRPDGVWVAG